MNYLTAIVALPLFLAIFAAESALIFSKRGRASLRRAQKSGQRIVWACWVVSLLQMVSCFFWFFGFVFSDTENVLSEAMKPDERMDCFGLVGAEVLLSVFQWIFSSVTFYQCLLMASVASNVQKLGNKDSGKLGTSSRVCFGTFVSALAVYTVMAWFTAVNRRCPQSDDIMIWFQHHFYPVYLLLDIASSLGTFFFARKILKFVNQSVVPTNQNGKTSTKMSSTTKRLVALTKFFSLQCMITIAGGVFACSIFLFQFSLDYEALSLIACVFCVLMYITYALRRVPMLANYLNFNLRRLEYQSTTHSSVTAEGGKRSKLSMTGSSATSPQQIQAAPLNLVRDHLSTPDV